MKKRYVAIIVVVLVGLVFWGLRHKKPEPSMPPTPLDARSPQSSEQPQQPSSQPPEPASGAVAPRTPAHSNAGHIVEGVLISPEATRYVQNVLADPQYDWRQPINFYGKVLDENNLPVEGASVDFKWTDLSPNGTSEYHTISGSAGLFSMVNQAGKRLSVSASKQGYYSAADARLASFEYANPADGRFTPDSNNPVVLHLRKKEVGVDLITSQYGVKSYFGVPCPSDGTPVTVDLLERKSGEQTGQLIISKTAPPYEKWKEATEWSLRMEILDGGFMEERDEFPFEAPESGYQPVIQFNLRQGQTNWTVMLQKDYYIKFGSPPRYGRLHLETLIEMQGARLTYAINPTGSRNLEPK